MTTLSCNGTEFQAYVAGAENAKRGLLIVHDWWGVQDYNRVWADRFAQLGYRVVVIDLYDGKTTRDPKQAGELMKAVDQERANAKLRAALEFLKVPGRKIATLGWSFGGRQALHACLLDPDTVAATVLYYSRMVTDVSALRRLKGTVLAVFAEGEKSWPEKMVDFENAMAQARKPLEVKTYDAEHGFINPDSPHYDMEMADAAWEATNEFLRRTLG